MPAIESSAQSPQIIAIDGPAASGKSTVGAELANRLGYLCLDNRDYVPRGYRQALAGLIGSGR